MKALDNKHFLFVTDEYYPVNNGGIARLLNTISNELLSAGAEVTILMSTESYDSVLHYKRKIGKELPLLRIYTVNELIGNSPYDTIFPTWVKTLDRLHLSFRCAIAIRTLCNQFTFDTIEFNDCWGYGYAYQVWRKLWNEPFTRIPTWVRLHGSMENCMIADLINTKEHFHPYHHNFFQMERYSLQLADGIISPSQAVAKWYKETYSMGSVPISVSVPSFEAIGKFNQHPRHIDSTPFRIMFYGRIQHLKGVKTIIRAVVNLIETYKLSIQLDLYGTIVNNYDRHLRSFIPEHLHENITFHGLINPNTLSEVAKQHHVAIISSKLETFCLAAHELNWIGIPLILNNIAAFQDFFKDGENCYFYNETVQELEKAILRFFAKRHTTLQNNAKEIKKMHNTEKTYLDILNKSTQPDHTLKYPLLDFEQYISLFYYIVFHKNFDSVELKQRVKTSEKGMKVESPFMNKVYSKADIDELNTVILLSAQSNVQQISHDIKETEHLAVKDIGILKENLNFHHQERMRMLKENKEIKDWYNNQYETLPLWYKRFGHVIKILQGKKSVKSVLRKKEKK